MKKSTEKIRTETIIKIDTVYKVKTDTVLKTITVNLTDTAKYENDKIIIKSYIDKVKGKLIVDFQQKNFNIPLTIYKRTIEDKTIKQVQRKNPFVLYFIIAVIFFIFGYILKSKLKWVV